ncbi:MAG: MFS transporter [Firmicutes bacterium HGW-Firmicutes-14]|nr:MAG: MFS transporter [Firmicutes bacterium HGW-Firmicutes-14]
MDKEIRKKFNYSWVVLGMGTLAVFGALGLARFGYTMVLPTMQADLGLNNGQAGLLATVNLIGYLALSIIGGALAARFGIRLIAALGLVLVGAGMVFTGLAADFSLIAMWRGLTGIGSGAANIAVMGLWPAWFSKQKRGLASGIAVSGSSIGLIFTGLFVPWVISEYGEDAWRICWFIFGSIALVLAASAYLVLRNNPEENGDKSHEGGGVTRVDSGPGVKPIQWGLVYLSLPVWKLGLIYTAFGFSYIIYMTFFVKYLIGNCGYTGVEAGRLFMYMGWLSLLCGLVWGMVSDSIGRKNTLIILFSIHAVAYGLFAMGTTAYHFTGSAILFGLTAWSIPAVMAAACGDMLGPKLAPAALGFITLFFGIGQALGPVVGGGIADATGSFSTAFIVASVVSLSGAVGSAFMPKIR